MSDKEFSARGTYVSRSEYQRVCEENKKLKSDIYALVMTDVDKDDDIYLWYDVWQKWHDTFSKEQGLSKMLRDYAVEYFKQHPEKRIKPQQP